MLPATQRAYQNYVDGYTVATNPSTASIAFAVGKAKQPLDQIAVLSIGTGEEPTRLRRDTKGWGMVSADNIRPENMKNLPQIGEFFWIDRPMNPYCHFFRLSLVDPVSMNPWSVLSF